MFELGPGPWVANRNENFIESYEPEPNTVCVSITESETRPATLRPGYVEVLRLAFEDWDPVGIDLIETESGMYESVPPRPRKIPATGVLFTKAQAKVLAAFMEKHRGRNFMVHCAAGVSRSGAVVSVILEWAPEYEDKGWRRYPNGHVRALLKRALGMVPFGAEKES